MNNNTNTQQQTIDDDSSILQFEFSIDRGGTFTDIYCKIYRGKVLLEELVSKLLSEDPRYGDGPREGIRRIIEQKTKITIPQNSKIPSKYIRSLRMGTTVATNALLERKGVPTALVVTAGFKDLLRIGNQSRPKIFDLTVHKPEVLYSQVLEVNERIRIVNKSLEQVDETSIENSLRVTGITGEEIEILSHVNEEQVETDLRNLFASGIEAISVVFMHSPSYPEHELIVECIAKRIGFKQISLSSKIIPMIKILPRGSTATLDAYLNPYIMRYVEGFLSGFDEDIHETSMYFMQSDGGLCDVKNFRGARSILSGPAGGVIGYAATSKFLLGNNSEKEGGEERNQFKGIIGFDMGGTSTDVSRFDGQAFEHIFDAQIAGIMIQTPHLDINTVAAGGGSRLFFEKGIFKVGPESAGATPGPVCYGRNGLLSITDANLILGRLLPSHFPKIFGADNNQSLFEGLTREKFAELANTVNSDSVRSKMSIEQIAYGFIKVANETMCRPIRNITQGKGSNPKHDILHVFGGAGGQHACAIADKLGMRKIFIHRFAGILSAFGLANADVISEESTPLTLKVTDNSQEAHTLQATIAPTLNALETKNEQHLKELQSQTRATSLCITHQRYLSIKYEGTDTPIQVLESENLIQKFIEQHKKEFGFILENRRICIDQARVRSIARTELTDHLSVDSDEFDVQIQPEIIAEDYVWFEVDGSLQRVLTPIYQMENLLPGSKVKGPAIILNNTSTLVIEAKWESVVTQLGNLSIQSIAKECSEQIISLNESNTIPIECDPIELSIFSNRFMGIAEQMGRTLQRTAVSTNIKERLDFSCAIFADDGSLVANAPHLPVHLGSMSEVIKYQIRTLGDSWKEGEVILTNHPAAGGSHLPDITVITPVFAEINSGTPNSKRVPIFYTASRGHHADVGGLTPGSMPPFSRSLADEGIAIKSMKIVVNRIFQESLVAEAFTNPGPGLRGTRCLDDNISDLKAQVSANNRGADLINALITEYSLRYVQSYMHFIQSNAEESVRSMLVELSLRNGMSPVHTIHEVEYMDDGTPIRLALTIDRNTRSAHLDFKGTGFQVLANTNTPYAVTTSAIIYSMRCLVNSEIPLNEGCLKPITFSIPKDCLLNPSENSPIVGGNVQTSQRVTDLILKAFQACAASYGCMNNVTFGTDSMSYYETIGGGSGAGPYWNGQDGVQCHMTNTRITDPEIFERRYPVLLRRFEIRAGSGGSGEYKGGDGLTREFEFLAPLKFSVLTERRVFAPFGLKGGDSGEKGLNLLISGGYTTNIGSKNTFDVAKCDRVIIQTPGGGGYGKKDQLNIHNHKFNQKSDSLLNMGSEFSFTRKQESN